MQQTVVRRRSGAEKKEVEEIRRVVGVQVGDEYAAEFLEQQTTVYVLCYGSATAVDDERFSADDER
jgi:hypothetical protein